MSPQESTGVNTIINNGCNRYWACRCHGTFPKTPFFGHRSQLFVQSPQAESYYGTCLKSLAQCKQRYN